MKRHIESHTIGEAVGARMELDRAFILRLSIRIQYTAPTLPREDKGVISVRRGGSELPVAHLRSVYTCHPHGDLAEPPWPKVVSMILGTRVRLKPHAN